VKKILNSSKKNENINSANYLKRTAKITEEINKECKICLDNNIGNICSEKLFNAGWGVCPICRSTIEDTFKIYIC